MAVQKEFCLRLRQQGKGKLPDNVSENRMALYQALNFHSINSIIKECFPVVRSIITDEQWRRHMTRFLAHQNESTPYFNQLPKAFLDFFKTQSQYFEYAFLYELAHYEWLELYIELIDKSIETRLVVCDEQLFDSALQLSPCAFLAHYHYEVDKLGASYLSDKKTPLTVVVYRDANHKVHFMRINSMTNALLDYVSKKDLMPREAMEALHRQNVHIQKDDFMIFATQTLKKLVKSSILVSRER